MFKYLLEHRDYAFITLLLLVFNFPSLIPYQILLDDLGGYFEASSNIFEISRFKRSITNSLINQLLIEVLEISPILCRLLIVIIFMIPTSLILFYLLFNIFGLSRFIAIASSTIPAILPLQTTIPTFIIGSYNIWGMFFFFLSIITVLKYLRTDNNISYLSILFGLLFFFSIDITLNIFITIPILYLILCSKVGSKHKLKLYIIIVIGILFKVAKILIFPWKTTKINEISVEVVLNRFIDTIKFSNPTFLQMNSIVYIWLILITLSILIYFYHLSKPVSNKNVSNNSKLFNQSIGINVKGTTFFLLIFISTLIIPLFFSPNFSSRYTYPVAFGLYPFLGFIIDPGLKLIQRKSKKIHILFILLPVFIGVMRFISVSQNYELNNSLNKTIKCVKDNLNDINTNTQVIITGIAAHTAGTGSYWRWSSGFLRYVTGNKLIVGLVGKERTFYSPFGIDKRSYNQTDLMSGLDKNLPTMIYKIQINNECVPLKYILDYKKIEYDVEEFGLYQVGSQVLKPKLINNFSSKNNFINFLIEQDIDFSSIYGFDYIQRINLNNEDGYKNLQFTLQDGTIKTILIDSVQQNFISELEIKNIKIFSEYLEILKGKSSKQIIDKIITDNDVLISEEKNKDWKCWSKIKQGCHSIIENSNGNNFLKLVNNDKNHFSLGLSPPVTDIDTNSLYLIYFKNHNTSKKSELFLYLRNNGPSYETLYNFGPINSLLDFSKFIDIVHINTASKNARLDIQIPPNLSPVIIDDFLFVKINSSNKRLIIELYVKDILDRYGITDYVDFEFLN